MLVLLIGVGLYRISSRTSARSRSTSCPRKPRSSPTGTSALGLLMLLRAFSSGAVALSGVEAVSNGVPAFRKPSARNAAKTLAMMAVILGVCFIGDLGARLRTSSRCAARRTRPASR